MASFEGMRGFRCATGKQLVCYQCKLMRRVIGTTHMTTYVGMHTRHALYWFTSAGKGEGKLHYFIMEGTKNSCGMVYYVLMVTTICSSKSIHCKSTLGNSEPVPHHGVLCLLCGCHSIRRSCTVHTV